MELTEKFLSKAAGWEVMKRARAMVERGAVVESQWTPPRLIGRVVEGEVAYRGGLDIHSALQIDNLCTCRTARQWGTLCHHSIAIGIHWIRSSQPTSQIVSSSSASKPRSQVSGPQGNSEVPKKGLRRTALGVEHRTLLLQVIFPPNFFQVLDKGQPTMIFLEGEVDGDRKPLGYWIASQERFGMSEQEDRCLEWLESLNQGETPEGCRITPEHLGKGLEVLAGFPRVTLGKKQSLDISPDPVVGKGRLELLEDGEIQAEWESPAGQSVLKLGESMWLLQGEKLHRILLPRIAQRLGKGNQVRISRAQVPWFLHQEAQELHGAWKTNFSWDDFLMETLSPDVCVNLEGGLALLRARVAIQYPCETIPMEDRVDMSRICLPDPSNPVRYFLRDFEVEQGWDQELKRRGFTWNAATRYWELSGEPATLEFLGSAYPDWNRRAQVVLEESLAYRLNKNFEWVEPSVRVHGQGENWFELEVHYEIKGSSEVISPAEVQRLLLSGGGSGKSKRGKTVLIDRHSVEDFQETLRDVQPEQRGGRYQVDRRQLGYLRNTVEGGLGWKTQFGMGSSGEEDVEKLTRLLAEFRERLRDYQWEGVQWLWRLRSLGCGGILADEMGLGKTIQTLAYLLSSLRLRRSQNSPLPSLVVCPSSLVFHWGSEARKFVPDMRVLEVMGTNRMDRLSDQKDVDLYVTSYPLLKRDAEFYEGRRFDTVILDEAQHIKNRQTQNALMVKKIKAEHRFVLTGTPMENSVEDLWSIFDFLMPGYLGPAKDFKARYEVPILKQGDAATRKRLANRVGPYLMRRRKDEVAKDLPPKLEQVIWCPFSPDQAALYKQVLTGCQDKISDLLKKKNWKQSSATIFTSLLRLRQVCCDPQLLPNLIADSTIPSTKGESFDELLDEILDGGHRVLVFSQFTSMLELLKERLKEREVSYSYLDGSTRNRGEVVDQFQNRNQNPVFLISLKAGGVGLNLTAADTVILYDPWWNPAVEDQATARVHRIGQTQAVTSYKLLVKNSVEEKIHLLQERKREAIRGLLDEGAVGLNVLDEEDLKEIFELK